MQILLLLSSLGLLAVFLPLAGQKHGSGPPGLSFMHGYILLVAMQVLRVAEMMRKNKGNQCHVKMALVPYGYNLTASKRQKKEGSLVLAGRLCCNPLAASMEYKSLATCSSFVRDRK